MPPPITSASLGPHISATARTGNLSESAPELYHHSHMSSSRGSISSAASSHSAYQLHLPDAATTIAHTQSHLVPGFPSTVSGIPNHVADDASSTYGASVDQEQTQLFACPYTKYDPQRYSASNLLELNYRGCGSCYLTDISRLKQHLYRVHERPQHYCPMCYKSFKTQEPRDRHIAARSCTAQPCSFREKMNADQLNIIKKKNRGTDPTDCWFDIYQTLFPNAPLPESAFATFASTISPAALDAFMQYVQDQAPQRFRQQLCDNMILNETQHGQMLSSFENTLGLVLQKLRKEYDPSRQTDPTPIPTTVTNFRYDDDEQIQRISRKRKATDSSLQVPPSGYQFSLDTQSMGSFGDVSAPHSLMSTPALRDDEPEPSSRRSMVSPVPRFSSHAMTTENMAESLYDPMIQVVTNESQWQSALATTSEPNTYYQQENPPSSSPQPLLLPEAAEWQTNMMTGANLTMGMGQPGYPANSGPGWMGKGGHRLW